MHQIFRGSCVIRAQDEWYRRAQLAVEKGDDELAKEALKRRKSNQENADTMKSQLDQQRKAVDQLISNTKCAACPPGCHPKVVPHILRSMELMLTGSCACTGCWSRNWWRRRARRTRSRRVPRPRRHRDRSPTWCRWGACACMHCVQCVNNIISVNCHVGCWRCQMTAQWPACLGQSLKYIPGHLGGSAVPQA